LKTGTNRTPGPNRPTRQDPDPNWSTLTG